MRYRFFTIVVGDEASGERELNAFLGTHRITSVERHLTCLHGSPLWTVCVGHDLSGPQPVSATNRPRVDYKEMLSPDDFRVFTQLREVRRAIAEREAVPVYQVFTNEQLATMVRSRAKDVAALGRIDGVGPKKLEQWGEEIVAALRAALAAVPAAPPVGEASEVAGLGRAPATRESATDG